MKSYIATYQLVETGFSKESLHILGNGDALTSRHPYIFSSQHITKTSMTEVISLTVHIIIITHILLDNLQICNKLKSST